MARTLLTNTIRNAATGTDPDASDAAVDLVNGNCVPWTRDLVLWIKNGDDATITVTIATPGTVGKAALAISDITGTVTAGASKDFGPFGREVVQSDGMIYFDVTGTTPTAVVVTPRRMF